MDLNELFRRHQLALLVVNQNVSAQTRAAAARTADQYAATIRESRCSEETGCPSVLSARTLLTLSGS